MTPVFYARLGGRGRELRIAPAVASWDAAGSPSQARSAAFIDEVCAAVADQVLTAVSPMAFRLDLGLPEVVRLDALHDLDNYLFPLVPTLAQRTGQTFFSVWATKRHGTTSQVAAGGAVPVGDPGGSIVFDVTTTASASTSRYKEQVRDQVSSAIPLPGDGVSLQLAFVVGQRRAWANLWKPTIDSLGAILGREAGARQWNARDGRVTDLGLHCTIDPDLTDVVQIAIRVNAVPDSSS